MGCGASAILPEDHLRRNQRTLWNKACNIVEVLPSPTRTPTLLDTPGTPEYKSFLGVAPTADEHHAVVLPGIVADSDTIGETWDLQDAELWAQHYWAQRSVDSRTQSRTQVVEGLADTSIAIVDANPVAAAGLAMAAAAVAAALAEVVVAERNMVADPDANPDIAVGLAATALCAARAGAGSAAGLTQAASCQAITVCHALQRR